MKKKEYKLTIGETCYVLRKAYGLGQVELGQKIGYVQSTVSKIERDIFDDVPFAYIDKLSQYMEIDIRTFQKCEIHLTGFSRKKRLFKKEFIQNGEYSSKLIFDLLSHFDRKQCEEFCKKMKFEPLFLMVKNIQFNNEMINKIYFEKDKDIFKILDDVEKYNEEARNVREYILKTFYKSLDKIS